jgi:hypothetical protein
MVKSLTVVVATGVAVMGASSLAEATGPTSRARPTAISVVAVIGRPANVPAGRFVKAYAYCPRGYYVTGGGAYNGAITEITSSPLPNMRGWFVDGTNDDPLKRTFQHRADAVCVKGSSAVPVGIATAAQPLRQAELAFAARHATAGGR